MTAAHAAVLLLTAVPLPAAPQAPAPQVLAWYQLEGARTPVTQDEVALEMGFHLRRKDSGRQACTHLVDTTLVSLAAEKAGVFPPDAEVRKYWEDLKAQLRAAGQKPEELPVVRNTPEDELLRDFAIQMAHERLVRKELALPAGEAVSPAMQQLWLQQARQQHQVIEDPDVLPPGVAARINEVELPILRLGRLLLRTADDDDRLRFVRQVVVLQTLDHLAREAGIEVGEADLRAELELRRADANADPRLGGLTFEQVLKSQGLTPEQLLHNRVFRAQVLQKRLVQKRQPAAALQAEFEKDRQAALDRHGARRHLAVIFSRALDKPNELVPRDFAAAAEHLRAVRSRIQQGQDFAFVAKIESDDPGSKVQGGDVGWLHRRNERLPDAVTAAAWALEPGAISEPVAVAEQGCWLVKVVAVEPPPPDAVVIERMQQERIEQLVPELLEAAKIELVGR